jgi:hypothetical protein
LLVLSQEKKEEKSSLYNSSPAAMADEIKHADAGIQPHVDNDKLETTLSHDDMGKNQTNHDLVDKELAQYASDTPVHVDEATNSRLRRSIDRRVLVIMIVTYFLQSVDKGALGFASIMGLQSDTGLVGTEAGFSTTYYPHWWRSG